MSEEKETVLTTHVEHFLKSQKTKSLAKNQVAISMACLLCEVEEGEISTEQLDEYLDDLRTDINLFVEDYKAEQREAYMDKRRDIALSLVDIDSEKKEANSNTKKESSFLVPLAKAAAKSLIDSL